MCHNFLSRWEWICCLFTLGLKIPAIDPVLVMIYSSTNLCFPTILLLLKACLLNFLNYTQCFETFVLTCRCLFLYFIVRNNSHRWCFRKSKVPVWKWKGTEDEQKKAMLMCSCGVVQWLNFSCKTTFAEVCHPSDPETRKLNTILVDPQNFNIAFFPKYCSYLNVLK
jgi:hypothetical protein